MICKTCGTNVNNNIKYCTKCGSILKKESMQEDAFEERYTPGQEDSFEEGYTPGQDDAFEERYTPGQDDVFEVFDPSIISEKMDIQNGFKFQEDIVTTENADEPYDSGDISDSRGAIVIKEAFWLSKKGILFGLTMMILIIAAIYLVFFSSFFNNGPDKAGPNIISTYASGEYTELIWVQLSSDTTDSAILYTLNGNDPDLTSTLYEKAINMSGGHNVLKARALAGDELGQIYTFEYDIEFALGTAISYSHDSYYIDPAGNPVIYTIKYSIPAVTAAGSNTAAVKEALKEKLKTYYDQYNNFLNNDFSVMRDRGSTRWEVSYQIYKYNGLYAILIKDISRSAGSGGIEAYKAHHYSSAVGGFISPSEYATAGGYKVSDIIERYNKTEEVTSGSAPPISTIDYITYYYDEAGSPVFVFDKML